MDQRAEMLEANAESVEEMTYAQPLTQIELEKESHELAQKAIEIHALEEEFKTARAAYLAAIKPIKEEFKGSLKVIQTRQRVIKGRVFILKDFQDGMLGIYDPRGGLITARRMTPEEGQMSITSGRVMKIASNG